MQQSSISVQEQEIGQSKRESFIEALTNVIIGYAVSVGSQLVIFPHFDIHLPLLVNLEMGLWFTFISLARSYLLRRWFNSRQQR